MVKIQFPMYLEKSEKEEFTELAKKRHITLTQLIRESLYAVKENPHILTPTDNKPNIEVILNALEISARQRINDNKDFQIEVLKRLENLETSNQLLMKKAKIPKVNRDELRKTTGDEDIIFSD